MSEQDLAQTLEEMADLRFDGTDERKVVTMTVNGTGRVIGVRIEPEGLRRLSTRALASGIAQALASARGVASATEGPVRAALREHGVEPDATGSVSQ
jgi:DNA-binding protein YbaB